MSDNDLLVVISEMLRKQDQQAEKSDETNNKLQQLFEISIRQFEEQHKFREQHHQQNQQFNAQFEKQNEFNELFLNNFEKQNEFNDRFLNKLDDIEKALKK